MKYTNVKGDGAGVRVCAGDARLFDEMGVYGAVDDTQHCSAKFREAFRSSTDGLRATKYFGLFHPVIVFTSKQWLEYVCRS
jgi:hypothetical protein